MCLQENVAKVNNEKGKEETKRKNVCPSGEEDERRGGN